MQVGIEPSFDIYTIKTQQNDDPNKMLTVRVGDEPIY